MKNLVVLTMLCFFVVSCEDSQKQSVDCEAIADVQECTKSGCTVIQTNFNFMNSDLTECFSKKIGSICLKTTPFHNNSNQQFFWRKKELNDGTIAFLYDMSGRPVITTWEWFNDVDISGPCGFYVPESKAVEYSGTYEDWWPFGYDVTAE